MNKDNKITLGSLFDGSGGFPLAAILNGIEPLWCSEIEPFPIRVTTKRLPTVKHLGDIHTIDGGLIAPVDIITFGSPCQNLSQAGNRKGLQGEQSSLFFEAIRIIEEMRCKTNGEYPRYAIWENVPGAFSSNKGEDFRTVLETFSKIKDSTISIPKCNKWTRAGSIVGADFSICWRMLDAQYFGVPQRRKRIFLVADFNSRSASEILFEPKSVSRNFSKSGEEGESFTGNVKEGACDASINLELYENHAQDARYSGPLDVASTIASTYGTGGNNQPFVVETYDIRQTSDGTKNERNNTYQSDKCRSVDRTGNVPGTNQGGIAIVYAIDRESSNAGNNINRKPGISTEINSTLSAQGPSSIAVPIYSASKASFFTKAVEELACPLVATDSIEPPLVNTKDYIVRRLTPTECARLQGFPDCWCDNLETINPTENDVNYWYEIFENYRKIIGKSTKAKSKNQVIKWLENPKSDSSEYKMWGNGVALPCVVFVLSRLCDFINQEK